MLAWPARVAILCFLAAGTALGQSSGAKSGAAGNAVPAAGAATASTEIQFSGEAFHGVAFEREIGHGLVFRLTPATSDEGGGWVIEILPPWDAPDDPIEFSEIATPPYHAYNDRYVAAAFGYSAREAVAVTARKFNFVRSVADEHAANEVVNAMLYPSTVTEAEKERIAAESATIKLCTGQLRIVRSRITSQKGQPDIIAWIKFDVVLNFTPSVTLQQILGPKPPGAR